MRPGVTIIVLWLVWAISWLAAASWSNATEKRVGFGSEWPYRVVSLLGAMFLFVPAHGYAGPLRFWYPGWTGAWICAVLVAVGFAFCWWARIYLGRLWSASITRKLDHHLVMSGPYAMVRHPIYTGILLAVIATAAVKGTLFGIVGALLIIMGLWMKARLEERWLRQELSTDVYDAYRSKVPMLLPFAPKFRKQTAND